MKVALLIQNEAYYFWNIRLRQLHCNELNNLRGIIKISFYFEIYKIFSFFFLKVSFLSEKEKPVEIKISGSHQ